METRNKSFRWLLPLMSALFLLSGLTACSSTEDSAEDSSKPKPEVPVNDDDWQTVPATGGTITKDSISITFPSGTFSEETKVAITEIQKGNIGGEYEASKFYQIALPSNASKTMAVKMKSSDKNDDISFVMNSPGFCISSCEDKTIETLLETNYSNGEYSASIPAFDQTNSVEDIVYLTIGLGHMISYNSNNASRTRGLFDEVLHEGKVKNVSYKIYFPWSTLCFTGKTTLVKAEMKAHNINTYVQQALTKIFDLGFTITGDRYLPIVLDRDKDRWGGFSNSKVSKTASELSLSIDKMIDNKIEERDIKCTVVHELFHFFQSEFDTRCQFEKGRFQFDGGGEDLEMAEMGAVWSEHLLNDGQLNAKWLLEDVLLGVFQDLMGLTNTVERWNAENWVILSIKDIDIIKFKQLGPRYQNQGYSLAPLLYYLCSTKEMEAFNFDTKSVEELYDQWSTHFSIRNQTISTIDLLNNWAKNSHDSDFFFGDQIDDYYLKLLNGELVKGIDIFRYYDALTLKDLRKAKKDKFIDQPFDKIHFEGEIYPFGYAFRAIQLNGLKDESLKNKKLVIKQEKEIMQTYLLTANRTDQKYERIGTVATGQDSIVVSGDKLESYRKADGTFDQYFFFVTTRTSNATSDTGTKPWKVTVELQGEEKQEISAKVEPDKVTFEAEGGTNTEVKITKGSYKYCDVDDIATPYNTWLSAKCGADGIVTIEAQPNTATEGREGKVYCWVSNKEKPSDTEKKYLGPVTVIQKAGNGNTLLDRTDLEFPVEGGAKFIGYRFGTYLWMKRQVADDTWLKSAWSIDYLDKIPYYPSNDNRFSNQLYVCCFPNETGKNREQTITFAYSMEKGFDFEKGVPFPVKIKQKGGSFDLDMMKNLFVGSWYTAKGFEYNKNEGQFYHRRYTFREDHTLTFEGQYTFSDAKPSSWIEEFSGTYSVLSYEVRDRCVVVKIKIPSKDSWYKGYLECWPHWLFFGYENTDGSISHGFYMERE